MNEVIEQLTSQAKQLEEKRAYFAEHASAMLTNAAQSIRMAENLQAKKEEIEAAVDKLEAE